MDQPKCDVAARLLNSCHDARILAEWAGATRRSIALWFGILIVMLAARGHCQEAIRMSIASEQAAAAQKTDTSSNYYNIHAGFAYFRFQGEMGIELNDNANYSSTAPDADIALRPNLNIKAFWPVTDQNTLALSAGLGYVEYLRDRSLSYLNISSDSGLTFNVYSGDFVFNLHDRFSAVQYQVEDPSVSASLVRFENTVGLGATWDLDQLILSAGYDYDTYDSLTANYAYSDNSSDLFNGKAAFVLSSTSKLGLEVGGGLTTYDQNILDNSTHYSIGPFYQSQFTPHIGGAISAGFTSYQFAHNGTVTNAGNFAGYYAAASVNHQLNGSFSHSVSFGRQIQLGITANLSEDYFVNYQATWIFIHNVSTTFRFSFFDGTTSGGVAQTYDQYGPGLTLGWRITDKLGSSLAYDYLEKTADVSGLGYTQNRVLLDFTYDF
jgi:hypothetical protein